MRHDLREKWWDVAAVIMAATHPSGLPGDRVQKARRDLRTRIAKFAERIDANGGTWGPAVDAAYAREAFPHSSPSSEHLLHLTYGGWAFQAVRYAWLVVNGPRSAIPEIDGVVIRGFLEAAGSDVDLEVPSPSPPVTHADATSPVNVRFRYLMTARNGGRHLVDGHAQDVVTPLAADQAPVVLTLRSRSGDAIDVRRTEDGRLLRPVLSPGSWRPADVGTFVEAAASGEPWSDNPYLPPQAGARTALHHMSDLTVPDAATTKDAPTRHGAEADVWRARAGGLVCIEGVVHRSCAMPTLTAEVTRGRLQDRYHVGWRFEDGLGSESLEHHLLTDVKTFARRPTAAADPEWFDFSVGEEEAAQAALSRRVRWTNQLMRDGQTREVDIQTLVTVRDPTVTSSDVPRLLEYLATWSLDDTRSSAARLSRFSGTTARWVEDGSRPDPSAFEDMADEISRVADAHYRHALHTPAVMNLRSLYVAAAAMVERDLAFAQAHDEEVASFAM